jgi:hypothetical protein
MPSVQTVYSHLDLYLASWLERAHKRIDLYCPFVRSKALMTLFEKVDPEVAVSLTMRWDERSFQSGSCDPEVYNYCAARGIRLYKHSRIHLKMFVIDHDALIHGSANLTARALGMLRPSNRECLVGGLKVAEPDRAAMREIESEADLVTKADYEWALDLVPEFTRDDVSSEPSKVRTGQCLLSDLPMSKTTAALWDAYQSGESHTDLERFNIPDGLNKLCFSEALRRAFLDLLIMERLTIKLREESMRFGAVNRWLGSICSDAQSLRSYEVKSYTDILFNWIAAIGDPRYTMDRPNYTEVMRYTTSTGSQDTAERVLAIAGVRPTKPS